jgi:hypothetical protein
VNALRAVAGNVVREVARSAGFRLYAAALLIIAAVAPHLGAGERLIERLQLAVSYGLGIPVFLIGAATLAVATGSLAREVERRHIHLLVSKPVRRAHILLGKLAGALCLALALLLLVVAVFQANLRLLAAGDFPPEARLEAEERFFTPRRPASAEPPAGDPALAGRLVVRPQEEVRVHFGGMPERSNGSLLLRYELRASSPAAPAFVKTLWTARGGSGEEHRVEVPTNHGLPQSFLLPASLGAGGSLSIALLNDEPEEAGISLIVPPGSIELLYPHGGLTGSLVRAVIVIAAQLTFLAAVGVFGAALFSLPTASLLAFSVYLIALGSGVFQESLGELLETHSGGLAAGLGRALARASRLALELMPDFSTDNAFDRLIEGRALSWAETMKSASWTFGAQAGATWLLAALLWRRRELAGPAA